MISECCGVKALRAKSYTGWYIDGELRNEWFECSRCKQRCDIVQEESNQEGVLNDH